MEHNTFVRIKHICCGISIGLELSTNVVAAERERQISNVDASLDLLLFGTSEMGRGRNRLVGGSGEVSSFKSPAYRSGDRVTQ